MSDSGFKCGFVGLIGPTNAGKSTLLNALVGEKLSIVSAKTQTTYHQVRGIVNRPDAQIILVDTPGLQNFSETIARLLNRVAEKNAADCDLRVWIFDVSTKHFHRQIEALSQRIAQLGGPSKNICVLNKVDKIPKPSLLPVIDDIWKKNLFAEIIPLSALREKGLENLISSILNHLAEAPAMFPKEMLTDRSEQFLVSEYIREKIYQATHQEVPYAAWVEIEAWENPSEEKKIPHIHATIHVDSVSKRGILVGKKGEKLKAIGMSARKDVERLLGKKVFLKLFVDVKSEWKRDSRFVNQYLELT